MRLKERIRKNVSDLVPCIHGARLSESAETAGKSTGEMLDFSVNLNPLGPPPKLRQMVCAASDELGNYPDNRYLNFRLAAAHYLNVSSDNIVPGNGSTELIRLFSEAVIESGDNVMIPSPSFGEYEFQCRLLGAKIEYFNPENIEISIENCKAVFLCNPNNPTGKLLPRKDLLRLVDECSARGVFLFVDEAFIDLADPGESVADIAAANDFVIVLRSLTKTFAIPGLRIGFAVASSDFAEILNNIRLHWNMNSIAAAAGEKLLEDKGDYLGRSLALLKKEREWLLSKLTAIRGFKPYNSDANFILIDLKEFGLRSAELTARMLRHGIIIRECTSFGLVNHIRVAIRKRNENRKLIDTLFQVIKEWGNELADTEIGRAIERGVAARSRVDCQYYPCHFKGQDCTFCFCPFYPCENTKTGGELIQRPAGGSVWSCAGCIIIHRADVAENVLKALMSGKKIKDVWKSVMEPLL